MKKISFIFILLILCINVFAQTVTLTFTGNRCGERVQLDSVVITNFTRNWTETIYWPDTVLTITNGTGIDNYSGNGEFGLSQNKPNPFNGTTDVYLTLTNTGTVTLEIVDVNGQMVVETFHETSLPIGTHQFRISLSAAGTYIMTAHQNGEKSSIKMVNHGGNNGNGIESMDIVKTPYYDAPTIPTPKSGTRGNITQPFNYGDWMDYVGYHTFGGVKLESEHIGGAQGPSQTHQLSFTNDMAGIDFSSFAISCPDAPTVTDIDGHVYNTIQIGQQCWMKENLRTTRYADNTIIPVGSTDSYTEPYRYAPNGDESNVLYYGFLYNWPAVMNGAESSNTNPSGVQGVCPTGWHVPSYAEWWQLTQYVKSIPWYLCDCNTDNIAKALASPTGWDNSTSTCAVGNTPSSNNATGFSALPAGNYNGSYSSFGGYEAFGSCAFFWSATSPDYISLSSGYAIAHLYYYNESAGYSVRCLRD